MTFILLLFPTRLLLTIYFNRLLWIKHELIQISWKKSVFVMVNWCGVNDRRWEKSVFNPLAYGINENKNNYSSIFVKNTDRANPAWMITFEGVIFTGKCWRIFSICYGSRCVLLRAMVTYDVNITNKEGRKIWGGCETLSKLRLACSKFCFSNVMWIQIDLYC